MIDQSETKKDILAKRRKAQDALVEKWKDHEYMKPFLGRNGDTRNAAVLFENSICEMKGEKFDPLTTELVCRTFLQMKSRRMFGFQPILANEDSPKTTFLRFHETDQGHYLLVIEDRNCDPQQVKMRAHFQPALSHDMSQQTAARELVAILSLEIALELDRKMLRLATDNAGTTIAWDFNAALGDTIMEKYEAIYVKLVEVSNVIHQKTLRGGGNFIVTSPEIASIFETAAGFEPAVGDERAHEFALGVVYVGTVNSKWRLYKDPMFTTNKILVGYKGDSEFDAGLCFAPQRLCWWDGCGCLHSQHDAFFHADGQNFYATLTVENFVI